MSLASLLTILGSACLHVVAHVALKQTRNREALVWWLLAWGCLLFAPVAAWRWQPVPGNALLILIISAGFEVGYFSSIARAYRTGDLSLVYPLARGSAPLFLVVWTTLFLAERPAPGGLIGIALVAAGLYVVNLPGWRAWRAPFLALREAGPRWALLAGLFISWYTAVDRVGIQFLDPFFYTYLVLALTLVLLTPYTLHAVGWGGLLTELRTAGWRGALAGFTTLAAYAIVLYVMAGGVPASYVGAAREISVVFGAGLGVFLLGEPGSRTRLTGAALVTAGVICIKLLG